MVLTAVLDQRWCWDGGGAGKVVVLTMVTAEVLGRRRCWKDGADGGAYCSADDGAGTMEVLGQGWCGDGGGAGKAVVLTVVLTAVLERRRC